MAYLDVLILSSSPRPFATYNMHSSSPLPSLSELAQKNPQILRTGSRAAPISQSTSASSTSAASLLKATSSRGLPSMDVTRSSNVDAEDDRKFAEAPPKIPKAKPRNPTTKRIDDREEKVARAPRKTAAKKHQVDEETKLKKARKPRAKLVNEDLGYDQTTKEPLPRMPPTKANKEATGDEATKEKPTRKARAKKSDGESQTKLSKGQVTKSSSKSISNKMEKRLKSKKPESALTDLVDPFGDTLEYGLIEAVKRRTDWTPPRQMGKVTDLTPGSASRSEHGLTSRGSLQSGERTKGFTDLFANFGFTKLDKSAIEEKPSEVEGPRKRKLIELIQTSVSVAAAASPKRKVPKKKARTITDQAISAYAEEEDLPAKPAPLLQYFSYHTTEQGTNDSFKVPPKPRSKSPTRGPSKAKRGSAEAPILLSPESALKQSGHQDFVFGTSSQLAREDSPTLLRDLHEAMQASNEIGQDDPFVDSIHETMVVANREKVKPPIKRNLWCAASRDAAGELLEVEMFDLVDTPAITKQLKATVMLGTTRISGIEEDDDVLHDIEGVSEKLGEIGPVSEDLQESSRELLQEFGRFTEAGDSYCEEVEARMRIATTDKSSPRNPKTARKNGSPSTKAKSPAKASAKLAKPTDLQKPDFSSYTTAQLAKEIASYRFKPVKKRDQMITLLEKCWEGKNRIALGCVGTNITSTAPLDLSKPAAPACSQMTASSPKRPRGRPRKDSETLSPPKPAKKSKLGRSKATDTVGYLEQDSDTPLSQIRTPKKSKKKTREPVEEISDSDIQVTPSPPRPNVSQVRTPPLPLQLSMSVNIDKIPELSPTSSQNLLFTQITRAIRNTPPSKDPSLPTWHEKILLYDPIILEDLTVWLNTGALEKVGWDGEVEPKEVKKWCESKSICCLWKENLRGGARSRY